ncbi:MAG: hypothetical protein AAGE61_21935, partial [Pseudomonadota bacterium]
VLSNEVSDDLIFKGNGIGGWIKQDGSPATYKDDLAIRQSNSDIQTGAVRDDGTPGIAKGATGQDEPRSPFQNRDINASFESDITSFSPYGVTSARGIVGDVYSIDNRVSVNNVLGGGGDQRPIDLRATEGADQLAEALSNLEPGELIRFGGEDVATDDWTPDITVPFEQAGFTNMRFTFLGLEDGQKVVLKLSGENTLNSEIEERWQLPVTGETMVIETNRPLGTRPLSFSELSSLFARSDPEPTPDSAFIASNINNLEDWLSYRNPSASTGQLGGQWGGADPSWMPARQFPSDMGFDDARVEVSMNWQGEYLITRLLESSGIEYRTPGSTEWTEMAPGQTQAFEGGVSLRLENTSDTDLEYVFTLPETRYASPVIRNALTSETRAEFTGELFQINPSDLSWQEQGALLLKADVLDSMSRPDTIRPGTDSLVTPWESGTFEPPSESPVRRFQEWSAELPEGSLQTLMDAVDNTVPMSVSERYERFMRFENTWLSSEVQQRFSDEQRSDNNSVYNKIEETIIIARRRLEADFDEIPSLDPTLISEPLRPINDRVEQYLNSARTPEDIRSARVEVLGDLETLGAAIRREDAPYLTVSDILTLRTIAKNLDVNFVTSEWALPNQSFSPDLPTIEIQAVEDFDENFMPSGIKGQTVEIRYPPDWRSRNQFPLDNGPDTPSDIDPINGSNDVSASPVNRRETRSDGEGTVLRIDLPGAVAGSRGVETRFDVSGLEVIESELPFNRGTIKDIRYEIAPTIVDDQGQVIAEGSLQSSDSLARMGPHDILTHVVSGAIVDLETSDGRVLNPLLTEFWNTGLNAVLSQLPQSETLNPSASPLLTLSDMTLLLTNFSSPSRINSVQIFENAGTQGASNLEVMVGAGTLTFRGDRVQFESNTVVENAVFASIRALFEDQPEIAAALLDARAEIANQIQDLLAGVETGELTAGSSLPTISVRAAPGLQREILLAVKEGFENARSEIAETSPDAPALATLTQGIDTLDSLLSRFGEAGDRPDGIDPDGS